MSSIKSHRMLAAVRCHAGRSSNPQEVARDLLLASMACSLRFFWSQDRHRRIPGGTMRFGSTAKVLAKCKLKYYRISECGGCRLLHSPHLPGAAPAAAAQAQRHQRELPVVRLRLHLYLHPQWLWMGRPGTLGYLSLCGCTLPTFDCVALILQQDQTFPMKSASDAATSEHPPPFDRS